MASSATEVTITIENDAHWIETIRESGLIHVGMWHTHPGYEPFQSDERFTGADVQATASRCQNWWSLSMVVDPISEAESGNVSVGCYKMVAPGTTPEDLQNSKSIGWRSIAFGIREGDYDEQ